MKLQHGIWLVGWLLCACSSPHSTASDGDGSAGVPSVGLDPNLPVAPPAQGAVTFSVSAVSPNPAGKMCPVGAAFTGMIPTVADPTEALDADTYLHHVIDGNEAAAVSCEVIGASSFTFAGQISAGGRSIDVTDGMFDAGTGSARISLMASQAFSGALASPGACMVEVEPASRGIPQIKPGSIWAHFSCSSVDHPPSDHCKAEGYFVLENCAQK